MGACDPMLCSIPAASYGEIEEGAMDSTYGAVDALPAGVVAEQEETIYDFGDAVGYGHATGAGIVPGDTYGNVELESAPADNIYGIEETEIIPDDTYGNAEATPVSADSAAVNDSIYGIGQNDIIPDDTYGNVESVSVSTINPGMEHRIFLFRATGSFRVGGEARTQKREHA